MTLNISRRNVFAGVTFIFSAVILLAGTAAVMSFGPRIESNVWPVTSDFLVYDVVRLDNGKLAFRASYTKNRYCRALDIGWYRQIDDVAGGWFIAAPEVEPVAGPTSGAGGPQLITRPLGYQVSNYFSGPEPGIYFAILHYQCGFPWETESKWGPFNVKL